MRANWDAGCPLLKNWMTIESKLIAIVLAVPIIAFAVAEGFERHFESNWRRTLERDLASSPSSKDLPLKITCANPGKSIDVEQCTAYQRFVLMQRASMGAALLGLSLLVGIAIAGRMARSDRRVLLAIFKPGLYVTLLALVALTIIHAGLLMASIFLVGE